MVDGTQPNAVGNGDCVVDDDKLVYASEKIVKVLFQAKVPNTSGAPNTVIGSAAFLFL